MDLLTMRPMFWRRSAHNLGPRSLRLWSLIRRFFPRPFRFFFEGHPQIPGQLWRAERQAIYDTVRDAQPIACFEIGTWKGGGSTFFIAQALRHNGKGRLETVDVQEEFWAAAQRGYAEFVPYLLPYVRFHLGDYRNIFPPILQETGRADLVFLDGAENAEETRAQFAFFLPYVRPGTILIQHDWFSEKAAQVKPFLQGPDWRIRHVLTPPYSLGMSIAECCRAATG